ncbi:hypothetical protein [Mongoliitalea daihaiensis]|uniref:hypothetical protein n=1 Tax=Mongoliitalea daihaiensis TaxID=2782006 RepID=UPI001F42687A|nr:hypothetical protein [Mongoliitalea daihaiensis]UJP64277.1 hypothetical protein IPZ59_15905 [Mongoliitalea daihaiensis]
MDAGNIIYLIAVIIYFIYSALKKNKPEAPKDSSDTSSEAPQQRPASFEDLLREIRRGQQEAEKDFEQTGQGTVKEERRPEPNRRVERPYQPMPEANQPKAYQAFQGALDEDYKPKYKTLDEQVRISASIQGIKSTEVGVSKKKVKPVNRYARMLHNPKSVRDAIVLTEILNRKF